jgi:ribosomal RNA-processing protein 36
VAFETRYVFVYLVLGCILTNTVGEKQKVIVQARYEALAKEGGQRAVKKAIEKKQKKESQKEKRSRPYAKGEYSGKDGDRPAKRRRV